MCLGVVFHIRQYILHGIALNFPDQFKSPSSVIWMLTILVSPSRLCKITQGFLIGTHQKNPQIILFVSLRSCSGRVFSDIVVVDEFVDFAVAVAGDVRENRVAGGRFIQPVNRHDRETGDPMAQESGRD